MHGGKSSAPPAESSGVAMTPTYVDSPRKVKEPLWRGAGVCAQGPGMEGNTQPMSPGLSVLRIWRNLLQHCYFDGGTCLLTVVRTLTARRKQM